MEQADPASIEQTVLAGGAVLTTVRGSRPGPTAALLGGVHGDEDEGVLAVLRVLHDLAGAQLAGTVRAVARANPSALGGGQPHRPARRRQSGPAASRAIRWVARRTRWRRPSRSRPSMAPTC